MIGTGERGTICGQPLGRLELVAGAAHDVGAGTGQRVDLLQRALDVGRLGGGHRLHRDRRVATDGDVADDDLPRLAAVVAGLVLHDGSLTARTGSDTGRRCRGTSDVTKIPTNSEHHGVGDRHELGDVDPVAAGR